MPDIDPVKVLARKVAERVHMATLPKLQSAGNYDKVAKRKGRIAAIRCGEGDNFPEVLSAEAAIRATVELAADFADKSNGYNDVTGNLIARSLRSLSFLKGQNDEHRMH